MGLTKQGLSWQARPNEGKGCVDRFWKPRDGGRWPRSTGRGGRRGEIRRRRSRAKGSSKPVIAQVSLSLQAVPRLASGAPNCYLESMSKQGNKNRSAARRFVTVRVSNAPRESKIKFGSVTISGRKPNAAVVTLNVERSTEALERVGKRLIKPGVTIRRKKDVPQYSVAEGETGVFIRRLNGRTERGRLVKGVFQVID
jgi:hypothetical protein